MKVTLSSKALREQVEAEGYYRRRSPAAATAFITELRAALRYIREHPEGSPLFEPPGRAKNLRRFPYTIIYVVERDRIFVLSIVNQYRDPDSYGRSTS